MAHVIVFDFDGVIVDSELIKQGGYSFMFSEFGEKVPEAVILDAGKKFADGKGSRADIIRDILTHLHVSDIDAQVKKYIERYGEVVETKVRALPVASATRDTLERLASAYPLYVNSITPQQVLEETVQSFGLKAYFKRVFGAPRTKVENLKEIARIEGIRLSEMLFVGDGEGDYAAAREFGCDFVGVATDLNGWDGSPRPFRIIRNLSELLQFLER